MSILNVTDFTLSMDGCQDTTGAGTLIIGTFTCEQSTNYPGAKCPSETGSFSLNTNVIETVGRVCFSNGTSCEFFYSQGPLAYFSCVDASFNPDPVWGGLGFWNSDALLYQQPECSPCSRAPSG